MLLFSGTVACAAHAAAGALQAYESDSPHRPVLNFAATALSTSLVLSAGVFPQANPYASTLALALSAGGAGASLQGGPSPGAPLLALLGCIALFSGVVWAHPVPGGTPSHHRRRRGGGIAAGWVAVGVIGAVLSLLDLTGAALLAHAARLADRYGDARLAEEARNAATVVLIAAITAAACQAALGLSAVPSLRDAPASRELMVSAGVAQLVAVAGGLGAALGSGGAWEAVFVQANLATFLLFLTAVSFAGHATRPHEAEAVNPTGP